MAFTKLTFTGVDADTDIGAVAVIITGDRGGLIEIGILRSPDKAGAHPRFPDRHVIEKLTDALPWQQLAFHLCDGYAEMAARRQWDALARDVDLARIGRIQVNLPDYSDDEIAALQEFAAHTGKPVIVQWRKPFRYIPGLYLLQDHSAGRGLLPGQWAKVDAESRALGHAVGYAGGLSPDNIAEKMAEIETAKGAHPAWLDCASGVRDADNRFDLDKVTRMIGLVFPEICRAGPGLEI